MAPVYDGAGSTADSSDQQLVARIRRGDDRAFELLYERYHRRIHSYVLGMVKDHGRAEDVTQEVFVSALRRMRETEQPLAFKPWLYQIAKNSCIDAFRRSKRAEEVSYDAEDALAPADHSKLVGSGPSPDAAVAAKQELESLCGAFGGLSETHHEILVLRELEGLSYQEIGRRMGMSRPAVESTLFRARRRLTEEYDDIVSGARCMRIQGIIAVAVESRLGARDTRRLARHLSHCQPCRREALAAGLDRNTFARPTVRERVATKVAGVLPFPAFIKFRRGAADASASAPPSGRGTAFMSQLPIWSDQLQSGWGKAAAGGALLLAGVGTGVTVHHHASGPAASAPAAIHAAPARAVASSTPTAAPTVQAKPDAEQPTSSSPVKPRKASSQSKPSTHRGSGSKSSAADRATSGGGGSTPAPSSSGGGASSSGGGGGGSSSSSSSDKPSLPSPASGGTGAAKETKEAVKKTTDAVQQTTQSVTGTVRDTTEQVTGAAGGAVQTVTGDSPVSDAVTGVTGTVNNTVGEVADGVDKTIGQTTGAVNSILGGGG